MPAQHPRLTPPRLTLRHPRGSFEHYPILAGEQGLRGLGTRKDIRGRFSCTKAGAHRSTQTAAFLPRFTHLLLSTQVLDAAAQNLGCAKVQYMLAFSFHGKLVWIWKLLLDFLSQFLAGKTRIILQHHLAQCVQLSKSTKFTAKRELFFHSVAPMQSLDSAGFCVSSAHFLCLVGDHFTRPCKMPMISLCCAILFFYVLDMS